MLIFKSKQKKFEGDLKIKLCGKKLYPTESVKYLAVKIDTNLSWQYHVNHHSINPKKADALLFKMLKYFSFKKLRSIKFAIFDSYLSYCSLVGALNCGTIQNIVILLKKTVSILFWKEISAYVAVHMLCYGCMQSWAIHNLIVSYGGGIIHACHANNTECQ